MRKNTSKFTYILFKLGKSAYQNTKSVGKHPTSAQRKCSCPLVVVKMKNKTAFLL